LGKSGEKEFDFDFKKCSGSVDGKIVSTGFNNKGFIFVPENLLSGDYWYRVTLKSGETGIRDVTGNILDGNKNNLADGSPSDDYVWHFKTKDEGCSARSNRIIELTPQGEKPGIIIDSGEREYLGLAIGPDCQILNPSSFTWLWSSTKKEIADIKISSINTSTAEATEKSLLGETKIKAEITPKAPLKGETIEKTIDLVVTTPPKVLKTVPKDTDTNVCKNTVIKAVFNQILDMSSISSETVNLYKGDDLKEVSEIKFRAHINEEDSQTVLIIEPGLLDSLKQYKVSILGGKDGIKSKYGLEMENTEEWSFTVSDQICLLSNIEIEPKEFEFNVVGQTQDLLVSTYDNNNNEITEITGVYDWEWDWQSSDESIVSISGTKNRNKTIIAQNRDGQVEIILKIDPIEGSKVV